MIVGAQGWLRTTDATGLVVPALLPEAVNPPGLPLAVVFSELDHPDADNLASRFAAAADVVALTRGARGATVFCGGETVQIEPAPAVEADPTGAGDVFGLTLGLRLRAGDHPERAGMCAAETAARVVEGPGLGRLAAHGMSPHRARVSG